MADPGNADSFLGTLKRFGLDVVETSGWRTHNREGATGKSFGPVHGVMIHHTAGVSRGAVDFCRNGTAELPGPLCHGVITKGGKVHLVGWGRANHAGGGDPGVLAAVRNEIYPLPLPDVHEGSPGAVDGNSAFIGFECVNRGDGEDPWPEVQLDAMQRAAAAVCGLYGWSARSVLRHLDWSDWKSDPAGFDWDWFTAGVQRLLDDEPGVVVPGTTPDTTSGPPGVSLAHIAAAARHDPSAPQGSALYREEVLLVERALAQLGWLHPGWVDGSFGSMTVVAYRRLQKHLGYAGAGADGIPGSASLVWLGVRTKLFRLLP